jgi:tRNA pseudouridine55 synthase
VSLVSGIAAISKPAGLTSFAALFPIKKALATGKVGHAGTLDRFATGLIIALTGSYSRLTPIFTGLDKCYEAVVRFGVETATLDPEGEIVAEAAPPNREAIEAVLPLFRGPIMQRPPVYSALHIDGKRAYERALHGEVVEMAERPVTIHDLLLLDYDGRDARLLVRCSSGTYVRSLARDLALAAGSRASLFTLLRSSIGPISHADAVLPELFSPGRDLRALDPGLAASLGLPCLRLPATRETLFRNGGRLSAADFSPWPPAPAPGHASAGAAAASSSCVAAGAAAVGGATGSAVFAEDETFLGLVDLPPGGIRYRFVVGDAR